MKGTLAGTVAIIVAVAACSSSSSSTHDVSNDGGESGETGEAGKGGKGGATASSGGTMSGSGGDTGEAGADMGSGGSAGAPPVDCPIGCLPPPPPNWTGPSAVYDGPEAGRPETCPDQYSLEEVEAHQGMSAEPAMCSCGPGEVSGERCVVSVYRRPDTQCGLAGNTTDHFVPGASNCISVAGAIRLRVTAAGVDLEAASCSFNDASPNLSAPTFERVNLACGLPVTAACESQPDCTAAPLPDAPFGRLCIHREGDVPCPGAGYGARFVAYRETEDTRGCGPCSGAPSGGTCGDPSASVAFYQDSACTQAAPGVAQNTCFAPSGSQNYLGLAQFVPTGVVCDSGSAPSIGSAASVSPVTFCCVR